MATVADLRTNGSVFVAPRREITEPINAPEKLDVTRFDSPAYNLSQDSHLYKLLAAICGDAGALGLKKELLYTRLQQMLASSHFTDLDRLYGDPLALPRISSELYQVDPKNQALTSEQWADVKRKDSTYRSRCLTWMRAIINGPTLEGMRLAGEAATGYECDVYENYVAQEITAGDTSYGGSFSIPIVGKTSSRSEIVIIPRAPYITDEEERRIIHLTDRLKPAGTLVTIYQNNPTRFERPVTDIASTSDNFNVLRLVTGRSDISWPAVDPAKGYWITYDTEEAPTYAFMSRTEAVTYLTIHEATATSWHQGSFNQMQRALFGHLTQTADPYLMFDPDKSFAHTFAPIILSVPWVRSSLDKTLIVNNYYPVGYFAEPNIDQFPIAQPHFFWASREAMPPLQETLTLNLDLMRAVNFIDFEIANKPIDFVIEYYDGTDWIPVVMNDDFPVTQSTHYQASETNPWGYFEMHFDAVTTDQIRITFTRREDPFPELTSDLFEWSVDLRNLRLMHIIASPDDYEQDSGTDILGNSFVTALTEFIADYTIDGDDETYWESQPNPTQDSVEALYFDLRTGLNLGTQAYLDRFEQDELDGRSQSDMEAFFEDGVVIDEVYIDPITPGIDLHLYYSLDDQADWEEKLWVPVPRNYKLHRGFHALPSPTFVKFMKLEFSNLAAAPYNPIEYPSMLPITYRKYPSWVQDYFRGIYTSRVEASGAVHGIDTFKIDPLEFGFRLPTDEFHTSFRERTPTELDDTNDLEEFVASLVENDPTAEGLRARVESQIDFNSSVMWQRDLIGQLDSSRSLSRFVQETGTGWASEISPPDDGPPLVQSAANLEPARVEKTVPSMWFPRKCRHTYQLIKAHREQKVAYFAAIREVGFYRRDYQVEFDEPFYIETLDDDDHIEQNEFIQEDWRWVV
jgi:hypothetical protein